jgi:hypothetical protein
LEKSVPGGWAGHAFIFFNVMLLDFTLSRILRDNNDHGEAIDSLATWSKAA